MIVFYKWLNYIKLAGAYISGVAVFIMMSAIFADIVSRNLTGASILGVYETTQNYLMILSIFPCLPYVISEGIMPRLEMFYEKFKGKFKITLVTFVLGLEVLVYVILFYYSLQFALTGLETKNGFMAGGRIYPLYPILFVIPISFFVVIVERIFILINNYKKKEHLLTYEKKEEMYF